MLIKITKDGDVTLTQPAWAILIAMVFAFGGWMTKISLDVGQIHGVKSKVEQVERILIYNHLEVPPDTVSKADQWPDRSPFLPYSFALSASQAVATNRPGSVSGTP